MNHKKVIKRIGLLFIAQAFFLNPYNSWGQDDTVAIDEIEVDTITEVVENEEVEEVEEIVEEVVIVEEVSSEGLTTSAKRGLDLFQGGEPLKNGGPACITCHNVTNDEVVPGGLFAKDLTDVYERMGEGLAGWLIAPPFPAMADSYNNNPLDSMERVDLTAFFKYANETKEDQTLNSGFSLMLFGGIFGLACILVLVQFLWGGRKRKMVKKEIFDRQNKAWDAKF